MELSKHLPVIWESLPFILGGITWTLSLVFGAMLLGLCLGIPLAVGHVYGGKLTRRLVGVYVWLFRGIPILVQLYLFYFGIMSYLSQLPVLENLHLDSAFLSALLVLSLTSAAYQSQIFRGAIQGLHDGQLKAARALGMTDAQAIRSVILPQALRLSIPAWSNEYSILLKDSALAFAIGVMEIMSRTRSVAALTHEPLPFALVAGVLFYLLTLLGVRALKVLENKVRIPGYARQGSI
ncbi:amino acid ABC transporter membrane protein 1, PAAT family (TC 3.A.1.3.-) [Desulfonatronum thiosulfatophilum]|uniref:Amino acid ABC transporter membrane protein 1, PAAT family (TC 3.A.1.3.-) n=1 Tax=Desulfonatronum thiosulfatophilum TaxID=617002 RepID=A0A1G6BRF9_9BACT|nr:amino acid ABC transporter permease [Desulfonatronum thiosulfatophilum]SDB23155.1 amino acid ABC transporter membrane protein 1, PAAT family (TC 3.A.1.3.-) [Desulfonatronum thiosulfatophilum]